MKKWNFLAIAALSAMALVFAPACSDSKEEVGPGNENSDDNGGGNGGDNGEEPGTPAELILTLTAGEATPKLLTFTITTEGTNSVYYYVQEAGAGEVTSNVLITEGTPLSEEQFNTAAEIEWRVPKHQGDTDYEIYALAANDSDLKIEGPLTMTAPEDENPDPDKIVTMVIANCESFTAGDTADRYVVKINDAVGNNFISLDVYTDAATLREFPEGTYMVNTTGAPGTIMVGNSSWFSSNSEISKTKILYGDVTFTNSGQLDDWNSQLWMIAGQVTLEDNTIVAFSFEKDKPFNGVGDNGGIGPREDIYKDIVFNSAHIISVGTDDAGKPEVWGVNFSYRELQLQLNFYTNDSTLRYIPGGTYAFEPLDFAMGPCIDYFFSNAMIENNMGIALAYYSYLFGSVKVTTNYDGTNADQYKITFDISAYPDNGDKLEIKASYEGPLGFDAYFKSQEENVLHFAFNDVAIDQTQEGVAVLDFAGSNSGNMSIVLNTKEVAFPTADSEEYTWYNGTQIDVEKSTWTIPTMGAFNFTRTGTEQFGVRKQGSVYYFSADNFAGHTAATVSDPALDWECRGTWNSDLK